MGTGLDSPRCYSLVEQEGLGCEQRYPPARPAGASVQLIPAARAMGHHPSQHWPCLRSTAGDECTACLLCFCSHPAGSSPRVLDASSLPPGKLLNLTLPDTFADPTGAKLQPAGECLAALLLGEPVTPTIPTNLLQMECNCCQELCTHLHC